jgi:hypothetical protein
MRGNKLSIALPAPNDGAKHSQFTGALENFSVCM